jgi:exonuclease SbcD
MISFNFAHLGDLHLGSYQGKIEEGGLNSRFIDFVKTWHESISRTKQTCDLCLIAGDIFKNKDPQPVELDEFAKGLVALDEAGIPTAIGLGNHDLFLSQSLGYSISVVKRLKLKNIYISEKPEVFKMKTKNGHTIQVQNMPYPIKSLLPCKTITDVETYTCDKINEIYEKRDKGIPTIFMGHFTVQDAVSGAERMSVNRFAEPVIPKSVFKGKDYIYVALGHLHRYQVLMANPLVVYCGSNNRVDFNEAEEDKGFVEVKVIDGKVQDHKLINVGARKFLDIHIDLRDNENPQEAIMKILNKKKADIKDAVIRVSVKLSEKNKIGYDSGDVIEFLEKHGCNYIQGNCSATVENQNSLNQVQEFDESMSMFDALKKYSEKSTLRNKERFVKFGEAIIQKALGGNNEV